MNPNPVISVKKEGTVLYSNEAGKLLLNKWSVGVGEKLSGSIIDFMQKAISQNSVEKMEVKVENEVYLITLYPIPDAGKVNIYGFDISDQIKIERELQECTEKYRDIVETANKVNTKLKETFDHLEELIRKRTLELEDAYISRKESEMRLAEAQMIAHVGNWDWNLVTDEMSWSDEMYRIFGLDPTESCTIQ